MKNKIARLQYTKYVVAELFLVQEQISFIYESHLGKDMVEFHIIRGAHHGCLHRWIGELQPFITFLARCHVLVGAYHQYSQRFLFG